MSFHVKSLLLAVVTGSALCWGVEPGSGNGGQAAAAPSVPPGKYLERTEDAASGRVCMQTGMRKFAPVNGKGPAIWLVGAAHVGDQAYYEALQKHLDAQTLVLYESVGNPAFMRLVPAEAAGKIQWTRSAMDFLEQAVVTFHAKNGRYPATPAELETLEGKRGQKAWLLRALADGWGGAILYQPGAGGKKAVLRSLGSDGREGGSGDAADILLEVNLGRELEKTESAGLQKDLADMLGLVFQMDGICYDRANFVNSDLSVAEIQARLAEHDKASGAAGGETAQFKAMMAAMRGANPMVGGLLKLAKGLLGASPSMREVVKLVMVEVLSNAEEMMASGAMDRMGAGDLMAVLIGDRNQRVVQDLKRVLTELKDGETVAVFYGAGHMADLEKTVVGELGYRPVAEKWLTVMSADPAKTGISRETMNSLRQGIRQAIRQQMELAGKKPAAKKAVPAAPATSEKGG
jgi:hypothetical protein